MINVITLLLVTLFLTSCTNRVIVDKKDYILPCHAAPRITAKSTWGDVLEKYRITEMYLNLCVKRVEEHNNENAKRNGN